MLTISYIPIPPFWHSVLLKLFKNRLRCHRYFIECNASGIQNRIYCSAVEIVVFSPRFAHRTFGIRYLYERRPDIRGIHNCLNLVIQEIIIKGPACVASNICSDNAYQDSCLRPHNWPSASSGFIITPESCTLYISITSILPSPYPPPRQR